MRSLSKTLRTIPRTAEPATVSIGEEEKGIAAPATSIQLTPGMALSTNTLALKDAGLGICGEAYVSC